MASCQESSLVRVIAPAQREELVAVRERLRTRREVARAFASSLPSRHLRARSPFASDPRWVPMATSTEESVSEACSRVRTRAPLGGATAKGSSISRSRRVTVPSLPSGVTSRPPGEGRARHSAGPSLRACGPTGAKGAHRSWSRHRCRGRTRSSSISPVSITTRRLRVPTGLLRQARRSYARGGRGRGRGHDHYRRHLQVCKQAAQFGARTIDA
jgi:hypothetical protein